MVACVRYRGVNVEELKSLYNASVSALKEGMESKGEINTFKKISFDREAIEKTFPSDYEPFRVKTHGG